MGILGRAVDWLEARIGIRALASERRSGYLLPRNINSWYSMGSILLFIFVLQVVSGTLLLVFYVPDSAKAFASVSSIMNDVPYGWLIRMTHAVGSNMMVAVALLHMFSVLFMG